MLEIKNLQFSYEDQNEPYVFNLKVKPKEIALVSGVSGVGKSTLLNLIAGFLKAKSGVIKIDEMDFTNLPPQKRDVSILFQENNLFEHLSVTKNLRLALPKNISKTEAFEKINIALKEVDLTGYENKKTAKLSGGQKQRIAFARTLLLNRKILLLDEPFAALDKKTAAIMQNLLKKLTIKYNWYVIIVSHNIEDVKNLSASHYEIVDKTLKKQ